jgi:hypothetical protein
VHSPYRPHLAGLALTLHPLHIDASTPQTSAQVHRRLAAAVAAIATVAQAHQCPVQHDVMQKVRQQWPALAARVDFWWAGVRQDVEHAAISSPWRRWATASLRPWVYGEHQAAHTRCARRKTKLHQVWETVRAALHHHALTLQLPAQALEEWHTWATQQVHACQRASSAVEGRNGALAQLHHHQRGVPTRRDKVWTVLPNFDCRAADGTTPAARFFRWGFPDIFATVLSQGEDLPRPRQRNPIMVLSSGN